MLISEAFQCWLLRHRVLKLSWVIKSISGLLPLRLPPVCLGEAEHIFSMLRLFSVKGLMLQYHLEHELGSYIYQQS